MQLFRIVPLIIVKLKQKFLVKTQFEAEQTVAPGFHPYGVKMPGLCLLISVFFFFLFCFVLCTRKYEWYRPLSVILPVLSNSSSSSSSPSSSSSSSSSLLSFLSFLVQILVSLLGFVYACVSPIIIPFLLIFFGMGYITYRYLCAYVFIPPHEGSALWCAL